MPDAWNQSQVAALGARYTGVLSVHTLSRAERGGALVDAAGGLLARLGVEETAQYLVRPDVHIGFRCAGHAFDDVTRYLERWVLHGEARPASAPKAGTER